MVGLWVVKFWVVSVFVRDLCFVVVIRGCIFIV